VKRAVLLLGLVLPVLAAGCGPAVSHVEGAAAPVTSSSPRSTSSPSVQAPAPAVLGPDGFGALKLGMTEEQATATGLIDRWPVGEGCAVNTFLRSAPDKGDGGRVYLNDNRDVAIIVGYPGVRTPEGIGIGTSKAAMLKAYPGWRNETEQDPHADGRGIVVVPGNSKAHYRMDLEGGKVTGLTLQDRDQNCYE
jgi:hypothetical protein